MLSYQKVYYPDGTTLYLDVDTFPFGFPPFENEEKKEKSNTEKLKDDSFIGIVQGLASCSLQEMRV